MIQKFLRCFSTHKYFAISGYNDGLLNLELYN